MAPLYPVDHHRLHQTVNPVDRRAFLTRTAALGIGVSALPAVNRLSLALRNRVLACGK